MWIKLYASWFWNSNLCVDSQKVEKMRKENTKPMRHYTNALAWCAAANEAAQDSQFSVFEGADEDVVFLHGGIFMAVGVDDLVAPKQETAAQSSAELTARVCVKGGETRGGREKENNIKDKEKQSSVNRLMHFTHEGRAD